MLKSRVPFRLMIQAAKYCSTASFITDRSSRPTTPSLEAPFTSGWIKDSGTAEHRIKRKCVVTVLMSTRSRCWLFDSQRCNDTLLSCLVMCEKSEEVCRALCTCMAGLEVCTHGAASLFYLFLMLNYGNTLLRHLLIYFEHIFYLNSLADGALGLQVSRVQSYAALIVINSLH